MSDNWISDLLILNELENQRMSKNPDDTGPGGLILVVVGTRRSCLLPAAVNWKR
ncbi:hypothetical protein L538_3184 [Bordetella hinzii 4161]|nr:hypothetical protein L538_3184 [Bordetella hinzii 4161]VEH32054.1 Uncharacterised protein [Bordetella hinzii]